MKYEECPGAYKPPGTATVLRNFWGVPIDQIGGVLFVGDAWAFIQPGTFSYDTIGFEWVAFTLIDGTKVRAAYRHLVGVREMDDE